MNLIVEVWEIYAQDTKWVKRKLTDLAKNQIIICFACQRTSKALLILTPTTMIFQVELKVQI